MYVMYFFTVLFVEACITHTHLVYTLHTLAKIHLARFRSRSSTGSATFGILLKGILLRANTSNLLHVELR